MRVNFLAALCATVFTTVCWDTLAAREGVTDFERKFLYERSEQISLNVWGLTEDFFEKVLMLDKISFFNPNSSQAEFEGIDLFLFGVSDWDELRVLQDRFSDYPPFLFDQPESKNAVAIIGDVLVRDTELGSRPIRFQVIRTGAFVEGENQSTCLANYFFGTLSESISFGQGSKDEFGCFLQK